MATTRRTRRRTTIGANAYAAPEPTGTIAPTPEQEAENAATRALVGVFGAISDAGRVAPLDQVVGIAMEALAFAVDRDEGGRKDMRRRIGEMKAELVGMLWERGTGGANP